ncbi:MAG: GNAT family N-acetyltransferase [Clostridia bacterium]|nr:GNAT family N-acetyltransferase [Clostridia bacterium]
MADAENMYENWVTDPEVCRFWQWEPHKSISETKALLAGWIEEYTKPDTYHWIIILKRTSQAIGYIYLADIDDERNSVSVHFALSQKYWNQGIMTEACKCILSFAFDALGAEKVHSNHHIRNPACGRVLQNAGMRYIKTAYKQVPECERISGDYCYYEIIRRSFHASNSRNDPGFGERFCAL